MKRFSLLLFLIISLKLNAQITIKGVIKGLGDRVVVCHWKDFNYVSDTISLDKEHKFKFSCQDQVAMYVRIETIEPNFFSPFFLILPNESLEIVQNKTNFLINGSLQDYNRFLLQLNNEIKTQHAISLNNDDGLVKYLLDRSDKFFASFTHPQSKMVRDLNDLFIITSYKLYPFLLKYASNPTKTKALFNLWTHNAVSPMDPAVLKYFERLDFNTAELSCANMADIIMVNNFIRVLRSQAVEKDSTLKDVDEFLLENKIIKQLLKESPFRSRLLGYNLFYRIKKYTEYPAKLVGIQDFIIDYSEENFSTTLIPTLQELYNRLAMTAGMLEKGAEAPAFNLPDTHGRLISLSDFKGKVLYIDIWASWCGPCLREMPYLNRLRQKFAKKGLEIISISIDTNPEKWLHKISELQLEGIQLIDSIGAENSRIAKDYKIYGVPHYLLIDKNGKIVSAYASRPSAEFIIEKTINDLLN